MSRPRGVSSGAAYPMRSVVKLTGLTAETVRAWERRYGAVEPDRTSGSARRYSEADIARLLLLRRVSEAGFSIGSVATLSTEALDALLHQAHASLPPSPLETLRVRYLDALRAFDGQTMQAVLSQAAVLFAPRTLVLELLAPIMRSVGQGWVDRDITIGMEHLATRQIRALVESFTHAAPRSLDAPRIVLAASEEQHHDLGLSMAAFLAAQQGVEPVLLGANVPFTELARAREETRSEVLVLAYLHDVPPEQTRALRARVRALAKQGPLWLALAPNHPLASLHREAKLLPSFEAFEQALALQFVRSSAVRSH